MNSQIKDMLQILYFRARIAKVRGIRLQITAQQLIDRYIAKVRNARHLIKARADRRCGRTTNRPGHTVLSWGTDAEDVTGN
jgi:hypothetical protein